MLYDAAFQPIVDRLKPHWTSIDHYIAFDDGGFETLLDAETGDYAWQEGDEREHVTGRRMGVHTPQVKFQKPAAGLARQVVGADGEHARLPPGG